MGSMRKTEADGHAPGLRERGGRDRLQRLCHAAAEVSRNRGHDAATTREFAQRAGVSVGTPFVYARVPGQRDPARARQRCAGCSRPCLEAA